MAMIYYTNGRIEEVTPQNGSDFKLQELKKIVGGDIEIIGTPYPDKIMVINEDSKGLGLDYNKNATLIENPVLFRGDYIAGNALVCLNHEVL